MHASAAPNLNAVDHAERKARGTKPIERCRGEWRMREGGKNPDERNPLKSMGAIQDYDNEGES
jgi:hypothetical protein